MQRGAVADDVEMCGSATKVLEHEAAGAGQGDLFAQDDRIDVALSIEAARKAIVEWKAQGLRLVTLLDEDYPAQLLTIHQRPHRSCSTEGDLSLRTLAG